MGRGGGALSRAHPHAGKRAAGRHHRHRDRLCEHLGKAGAPRRHCDHRPDPRRGRRAGKAARSGRPDGRHLPRRLRARPRHGSRALRDPRKRRLPHLSGAGSRHPADRTPAYVRARADGERHLRGAAPRQGTGVPAGRGRRVRQREALFQRNGPRPRRMPGGLARGVRRYGARRTGLARPGGGTSGDADAAGYAAADGGRGQRSRRPLQHRAARRERRAALGHEPCQRRGGSAADRAPQGHSQRLPLHQHADGAGDYRRRPAQGDGAQRGIFHPKRRRLAAGVGLLPGAQGGAL